MVLKGTKRSLRTGNTLRHCDRRTSKHTASVIVRHAAHFSKQQETDIADDSFLTADSVEFSLNKKGRWNLPDVIEENIRHDDFHSGGDVRVSVLRRHRMNRQNDCFGVVANTDGDVLTTPQRKKARRKTYCNGLNVLHNGRGKSTKATRKKRVVSTTKQKAQQQPETPAAPEAEPEPCPTAEVRYDVFYPVPASSALRFNPKMTAGMVGPPTDIEQRLVVTSSALRSGKSSNQRHRHISYEDMMYEEEDDIYDDDWDTDYDYQGRYGRDCMPFDTEDLVEDPNSDVFIQNTILLSDVVEEAFTVALSSPAKFSSGCRKARRSRRGPRPGGRFFYRPEAEDGFDSCLEDAGSEASADSVASSSAAPSPGSVVLTSQPIPKATVRLARDATSADVLTEQYGSAYSEAACLPRRLVIDITDHVHKALRDLSSFSDLYLPSLDLTSYVIFTYICSDTQKNGRHDTDPEDPQVPEAAGSGTTEGSTGVGLYDVYRVQLNMNCLHRGLDLHMPSTSLQMDSVGDVIRQVLDFVTTLRPELLARKASEASPCLLETRLKPDFDTVAEVNGWTLSCVSLLNAAPERCTPAVRCKDDSNTDGETGPGHRGCRGREEDTPALGDESASPGSSEDTSAGELSRAIYCGICFEDIVPGSGSGPHGTALSQCRHWFCEACWHSHLAVTTREGVARKLQCPEFRCEAEVDRSTLLSLLHVRDVLAQQRRQVEVAVTRQGVCKWCPNPQCGRVVLLTASPALALAQPTSMACPCGKRFCFACHGDPHWPLSCQDRAQYDALLRQKGDSDKRPAIMLSTDVEVRGKNCPKCNRFIVKEGGCPYMTCLCRHTFWWCCRKSTSYGHNCPSIMAVTDNTNTTRRVIKHVQRSATEREGSEGPWYTLAVQHRTAQHPRLARQDCQRAQQLRNKLLALTAKGADIGLPLTVLKTGQHSKAAGARWLSESTEDQVHAPRTTVDHRDSQGRPGSAGSARCQSGGLLSSAAPGLTKQHVRQATVAMTKLKLEIHSVVENTAALLHLRQQRAGGQDLSPSTVSCLKNTVERLAFLASTLHLMLDTQGPHEVRRVLPWFRHVQREVKDSLTTLARVLRCQQ